MTNKYPCNKCLVLTSCSKHCDEYLDYHCRWIRAYCRTGVTSRLYKDAKQNITPGALRMIKKALDGFFNVKICNSNSRGYVTINRYGIIVDRC
jgi:hypothetical protein